MSKRLLVVAAYCWIGLAAVQAQTGPGGTYQEPMPIQPYGGRPSMPPYGAGLYPMSPPARFPGIAPVPYPAYAVPQGWPRTPMAGGVLPAYAPSANMPTMTSLAPSGQDEQPAPSKDAAEPSQGAVEMTEIGAPAEPAEPYMVAPPSAWKPRKGYSYYGSAEYLFWFVKDQPIAPNVGLSVVNPAFVVGEFSGPGHQGARFLFGTWLSDEQDLSLEAGYLFLGSRLATSTHNFGASDVALRPIFAGIDAETGTVGITTSLYSAEANVRYQALRFCHGGVGPDAFDYMIESRRGLRDTSVNPGLTGTLDILAGFRFIDLSEGMTLANTTQFRAAPVLLSNALVTTTDSFGTHNHLFAGQIGADAGLQWKRLGLNVYTKIGFADNQQTVIINGNTQVVAPPVPLGSFTVPGGFFAQASNSGRFHQNEFAVIPEVGANLSYKLGDHFRVSAGYSALFLNNVVRPGDQIDATAGGATRPSLGFAGFPAPQPAFLGFVQSSFWAQGLTFGVEVTY